MQYQAQFQQQPRDPGVRKLIRYNEKKKTTFSCSPLKTAHRKVWSDCNDLYSPLREMRITTLKFMAKPARSPAGARPMFLCLYVCGVMA